MKKTLLSIITLATFSFGATAQNVNIPDANFKAYLLGDPAINTDTNPNEISVAEASAFTGTIDCSNLSISDLTGIEAFTDLSELYCGNNSISNLDVSFNTDLTLLYCSFNLMSSVDLSNNLAITHFRCNDNINFNNLDVSNNTNLTFLDCSATSIINLDLSNNSLLTIFNSHTTSLTSLNLANGNNTIITNIILQNNPTLSCVEVDDVSYSTSNWTNVDHTTTFSLDCNSLSISKYELAKNITIYPNPATSRIYINSNEVIESIAIIDVFGKIIERNLTFNNGINISNLSKGIYFLQVSTNKGLASKKFVKE